MKKLTALLLALSMALLLCACGNGRDASNESRPDPTPTISDNITPPDDLSPDIQSPGDSAPNNNISDDTNAQQPEPGETPDPELTAVAPSGLIIMTVTDSNMRNPKISCLDPQTGQSRVIAEFNFAPKSLQDTVLYFVSGRFYCGCRDWFADNYSKIAVSRMDGQSGQSCAGWMDTDGNFFNVNEALGQLNRSDFDDAVQYYAMGFLGDEYFVYRQVDGIGLDARISYHYVPLNDLSPVAIQDGVPFPGCTDKYPEFDVSDCISESQYLINTSDGVSKILDVATGVRTEYVPGTSRFSWHAVLSPNGEQVAFMSQPKNGTEKDIYIMPLAGGDPVKVSTDGFKLSSQRSCENGYGPDDQCTMLVAWE